MSLSTIYSKTGKGAQVLTGKNKALPADSMRVLSHINGESNAEFILAELGNFTEQEFIQILALLLEGGHIRIVADDTIRDFFSDSGNAGTIDVMEISAEEFLKTEASAHGLDNETKIREQKEAEIRAKAHAEEQARLETAARVQEERERQLLDSANILGNSADSPDKEVVPIGVALHDDAISRAKAEAEKSAQSITTEKAAAVREQAADAEPKPAEKVLTEAAEMAGKEAQDKLGVRIAIEHDAVRVRQQVEEKARITAEREAERVRQEAAATAMREAEEKARIVAEVKAHEEAARILRRKTEAEVKARLEIEEKARIATEREAGEKARKEAAAIARREAEDRARTAADLKARNDAEEAIRKTAEAAEKARAKEATRLESEARALIKAEEKAARRAEREPINISRWVCGTIGIARKVLISLSVTILVLLLLLQLINLGMLVSPLAGPVEKLLSESINEPVTIKKVYASLWPKPHLVLDGIAIGGAADIKIETIHVLPSLTTLFDDSKTLSYIKVSGLNIDQDNFHRPTQWFAAASKHGKLKFDRILLEKTEVMLHGLELPVFDGELDFNANRELKNASLITNNHKTIIRVTPRNGAFIIDLAAEEWQLPMGAPVMFDELHATGLIENNQLNFSQIKGRLYGGNLKASTIINWTNRWEASGNFKLSEVDLEKLLPVFTGSAPLSGPITSSAAFSAKAEEFSKLFDNPAVSANFSIDVGSINTIDLGRAIRVNDGNAAGGSTRFNTLTGKLSLQDGNYKFRQLTLKAGQLNAAGEVDIQANQDISGPIDITLSAKSRQLQSHLTLSGKMVNPVLK
jgi:AsmA-like protein